jgi:hypothetical protein
MRTILTFILALIISQTFGQGSQTFDVSGNFTVPKGVTSVKFEGWGRGGDSQNNAMGTWGGGGGAYGSLTFSGLTPNSVLAFTVGATVANPNTVFNGFTVFGANGRNPGAANTPNISVTSFAGGFGAFAGGGGAAAGSVSQGANASGTINGTGNNGGGSGGGGIPGGGGSLTSGSLTGANGRAKFTWSCPSGTISYANSNFVKSSAPQTVSFSSGLGSGGTFSASPAGLSIDANTGTITPASSNPGTFTVTYSIVGENGCSGFSTTATVRISHIYVDANATGLNDGTSWANAFTSLESALAQARTANVATEIWVADGIYRPSQYAPNCPTCNTDVRNKTFSITDNIQIYGGFSGTESSLANRQFFANSILSGDINNTPTDVSDDAYHVLIDVNNSGAVVDGFVIRNGNANGGSMSITKNFTTHNLIGNDGGGIYTSNSSTNYNRIVITQNRALDNGGGVLTYLGNVSFTNTVMVNNTAGNIAGAIMLSSAATNLTNCTVVSNTSNGSSGAIYASSGTPTVTNSIFYNNTFNYAFPTGITVTYSIFESLQFQPSSIISGTQNKNSNPYFRNITDPDGNDNVWMTNDDGLRIGSCSPAIEAGLNSAMTISKDIINQNRVFDVAYIPNPSDNTVDIGAYENQSSIPTTSFAGTIGNPHIVPFPQEFVGDEVTNILPPPDDSFVRRWFQSVDNQATWTLIANQSNLNYLLPNLTNNSVTPKEYFFKRVVTCNATDYSSNSVKIEVQVPNGAISGKVVSVDGVTGVQGIQICAQKTAALPGSPVTKQYCTTTQQDGTFSLSPIFYGDRVTTGTAEFVITPSYANHVFTPTSLNRPLTSNIPQVINVNFTDNTVYNISGKVRQTMTNAGASGTETLYEDVDGVDIFRDNTFSGSITGFLPNPSPGGYGRYAVAVQNPLTYKIEPKLTGRTFSPAFTNVAVTADVANVDFEDITTRTISGSLKAGCGEFIGTAVLEFRAELPNGRTSNFFKRITTNGGSGSFSVTLPARKYKISVVSFTVGNGITGIVPTAVVDFINALPSDSLIRDISSSNKTLNLVYPRPPVLELVNFDDVCTSPTPFVVMEQNINKTFTVRIRQGQTTCPSTDSTLRLTTNIHQAAEGNNEDFIYLNNQNGNISITLKGGEPNIISPHYKIFNLQYTDRFQRQATAINRNVVVTGLKSEAATFTTVSPQIPLKVLHDPPGDLSYSFWESSSSNEQALRFYRSDNVNSSLWTNIKIGTKLSTGIGVETENEFWGQIGTRLSIGSRRSTDDETILTSSQTTTFSTASNPEVTGSQGDVYIGAAINLKYAKATIISHSMSQPCVVNKNIDFIIAPNGFATQYIYSESHIVNNIIPTLKDLRDNTSNTPAQRDNFINQIKIWEQIVTNNASNKRRAVFDKNVSFDGGVGEYSDVSSTTSSKSSTVEFALEVDSELAAELGFDIAGSGVNGGSVINTKFEIGDSKTNTSMTSSTTGYFLDDDDNGDAFTVDVKKDPVYNTPVFELIAGDSSCPPEEGTRFRDAMQLTVPVSTVTQIDPNGEGEFILKLGNLSSDNTARTYKLAFDQSTNPNGATIKIGGSPYINPISYSISPNSEIQVLVKVGRGASNIFAYTGLTFTLSDDCGGNISRSASINAYFSSPCSGVSLAAPINNWSNNSNFMPILIKDYNIANLNSVSLEFAIQGSNSWVTAFTKSANQLANDPSGTLVNWEVTSIPDGNYSLRLKLICQTNTTVFSETVVGVIDRKAPIVFGIPTPTDDNFVNGDLISIQYNENLGCDNLNNSNLLLKNVKTNTVINAQLGCFQNKIVVAPLASMGVLGDSVRVTLTGIRDLYGNIKTTPDTWRFILGNSVAATGNTALSLSNTGGGNAPIISSGQDISMNEDAAGTLDFYFNLPANAPNDVLINYSVSGSANAENDYTVSYFPANQPNSTKFNGTTGTITIKAGSKTAILKIDPTADTKFEGNETIIITINEGGNYGITNNFTMTGTILNDDADDCLNGGNTYQLSNNNQTNTAIEAGTYHKGRIETVGSVVAPTNVTIKAQNSVLLKPGFEIKAGSVFRANIENCPQFNASFTIPKENNARLMASNTANFTENVLDTKPMIEYGNEVFVAMNDKKIDFEFKLNKDEKISLFLIDQYGAETLKMIENKDYKAGTYTATIETEGLRKGDYFIRIETEDKKTYQMISVK